jgi:hypothetical protein
MKNKMKILGISVVMLFLLATIPGMSLAQIPPPTKGPCDEGWEPADSDGDGVDDVCDPVPEPDSEVPNEPTPALRMWCNGWEAMLKNWLWYWFDCGEPSF